MANNEEEIRFWIDFTPYIGKGRTPLEKLGINPGLGLIKGLIDFEARPRQKGGFMQMILPFKSTKKYVNTVLYYRKHSMERIKKTFLPLTLWTEGPRGGLRKYKMTAAAEEALRLDFERQEAEAERRWGVEIE